MAHPHVEHGATLTVLAIGDAVEQAIGRGGRHFSVAELAVVAGRDPPAELLRHRLHAVADAEHRDAEFEDRARRRGRLRLGGGLGAAGKDDALRAKAADFFVRDVPRVDFAVDAELADPPGDELRVLRAEVEDQDAILVQVLI